MCWLAGGGRVINELPGELGPGNVRPSEPTIQHYFWTRTLCKHFSGSNSTAQFPDSGSNTGTYIFGLWSHSATINFRTLALIQLPVHNVQTPNYTYLFGIKLSCVLLISFKVVVIYCTFDVYCASIDLFPSHSQAESMNICYKYVTCILAIKEWMEYILIWYTIWRRSRCRMRHLVASPFTTLHANTLNKNSSHT
jgi:hypothetical protein